MTGRRWVLWGALGVAAGLVALLLLTRPTAEETAPDGPRGQWHRLRGARPLTAKQKREMARLESLSYLGGYKHAPPQSGVTVHDRSAAHRGLNLIFSGHGPEATLIDMDGRTVHSWRYAYAQAARANPALRGGVGGGRWSWRRGHLLDNGDLLAIYDGLGLIKIDRSSKLLWAHARGFHHDLFVAGDGTIHALTRRARIIPRISPEDPVLVDYITRLSPAGKTLGEIALLEAFEGTRFAHLLGRLPRKGDLFHTNAIQVLDGRHAAVSPVFRKGNLLVSVLYMDAIAVVDPERGKVVWAAARDWKRQHEPTLLPGGTLLLYDNLGAAGQSRVIELEPLTLKTVWEYRGSAEQPFFSAECGTAHRLPNGNTLIVESLNGRAFEVTRGKRIVWELYNPHRAGKDRELIATLFDVVRLPADFPLGWLPTPPKETAMSKDTAPVIPRSPMGRASLKLVGFSADGQRLAFETSGQLENTGMSWARTHLVDTASGRVVGQPVAFQDMVGATPAYREKVAALLKDGGIVEAEVERLARRGGPDEPCRRLSFRHNSVVYDVRITEERWENERCLYSKGRGTRATIELRQGDTLVRTLARDLVLPEPDSCSADYRLEAVYRHKRVIAVALEYVTLGKGTTRNQAFHVVAGPL